MRRKRDGVTKSGRTESKTQVPGWGKNKHRPLIERKRRKKKKDRKNYLESPQLGERSRKRRMG